MILFLKEELKSAVFWMKGLVIGLVKWIFRWLLRFGMIGALLLAAGKGCFRFLDSPGTQPNTGAVYPLPNAQGPPASQSSFPNESGELPRGFSNPVPERSDTANVRSAWSTLNYMAGDLTRWMRKR